MSIYINYCIVVGQKKGNEKPNAYKIFCWIKGVSDGQENRVVVNSDDKKLDVSF